MWVYLFDLVEAAGFGVKSESYGTRARRAWASAGARSMSSFCSAPRLPPTSTATRGYGNVLSISRSGNELHPTQKPVELLEKLVDNTDFATGVYDPRRLRHDAGRLRGIRAALLHHELTPAFTDVIVKRYIRITGKTTVRCVRQGRELPREEIAAIFEPDEEGG